MLTQRATFDSAEHFYRWLNVVAHRIVSNWQRSAARIEDVQPPERAVPDLAETVEPRLLLDAAIEAMSSLPERDRRALTTALGMQPRGATRRERDRVSLQVLRARRRLRERLEGWWAAFPWWRWWVDPAQLAAVPSAAVVAVAVTVAAMSGWQSQERAESAVFGRIERVAAISSVGVDLSHVSPRVGGAASTPEWRQGTGEAVAPASLPSPGPVDHRIVLVPPAGAPGTTEGETRPRNDDALVCWGNLSVVADTCVPHPLRRDGEWMLPQH
jgi:hypothetical protein